MTVTDEELATILARVQSRRERFPTQLRGSKRTNLATSEWLDNWWVGYGKDESCSLEGTPVHMRWLALAILGLVENGPYSSDDDAPTLIEEIITELQERRVVAGESEAVVQAARDLVRNGYGSRTADALTAALGEVTE